jgi:hypothetical protein
MNNLDEYIGIINSDIPILGFILNLSLTAILSVILRFIYVKYGDSLSNRLQFGKNFLLLAMTTMLIITIVKSSLALSLGLVGALSIIRFRAAIKEPEELGYLFLAISIGLGFGANQTKITILAFALITLIIYLSKKFSKKYDENKNLHLIIQTNESNKIDLDQVVEILKLNCTSVDLRRLDETEGKLEASFMIEASSFSQIKKTKDELNNLDEKISISFLDNKGII